MWQPWRWEEERGGKKKEKTGGPRRKEMTGRRYRIPQYNGLHNVSRYKTYLSLSISCCLKFLKAKSSILWMNDSGTGCTDNCAQGERHMSTHSTSHPHTHTLIHTLFSIHIPSYAPSHPHTYPHTHPLILTHTHPHTHPLILTHLCEDLNEHEANNKFNG